MVVQGNLCPVIEIIIDCQVTATYLRETETQIAWKHMHCKVIQDDDRNKSTKRDTHLITIARPYLLKHWMDQKAYPSQGLRHLYWSPSCQLLHHERTRGILSISLELRNVSSLSFAWLKQVNVSYLWEYDTVVTLTCDQAQVSFQLGQFGHQLCLLRWVRWGGLQLHGFRRLVAIWRY